MISAAQRFDRAAPHYDADADPQKRIAADLVAWAHCRPASILDLGSGTGFVGEAARVRWPSASQTALDLSPRMLDQARGKIAHLRTVVGDAAVADLGGYDAVFSSMVLQWLDNPRDVLVQWIRRLDPGARLFVAVPVKGSFKEWQDLCSGFGLRDNLFALPDPSFADHLGLRIERRRRFVEHPSAQLFLKALKRIGATAPRPDARSFPLARMRPLLASAPRPFGVHYEILYIEAAMSGSI